ncbi:MaoC family dehydratase [Streptomyces aidingensis]|uniref:Acyl dehydratase n=1 Tax=Streptomyces aidingensis TaxID=910347 RepID=A0A1I1K1I5_9ACTN|nr:MaoC/PaaZ C-terminal domain-containing protein [Streptomyces aidingensis]SFC54704.1 Acyl dehydratase [Streptomyces aidingensis]
MNRPAPHGRPPGLLGSYARALLPMPSPARRRGGGSTGSGADVIRLPDRRITLSGVPADADHLRRYADVCGFPAGSGHAAAAAALPLTYPHLVGFPLQLRLMARRDFPFPLLGLVHIANEIERLRPLTVREPLSYAAWAEEPSGHPRGTAFTMAVGAAAPDGATVWRSRSTYLHRHRHRHRHRTAPGEPPASPPGVPEVPEVPEPPADGASGAAVDGLWRVPGSAGRAYARVSGDRNPIHLHPLPARLLGFPRAIAHGMWTKARCLAALDGRLPDACRVRVTFHAPVLLPAEVRFRAAGTPEDGRGLLFALTTPDGARTHLRGEIT